MFENFEKGIISIPEWLYLEIEKQMAKYHWMPVAEYTHRPEWEQDVLDRTKLRVEGIIKETEKSVQVILDTQTTQFNQVAKGYKTWLPKSQISIEYCVTKKEGETK